jgi:hypothetical protein
LTFDVPGAAAAVSVIVRREARRPGGYAAVSEPDVMAEVENTRARRRR